MRFLYIVKEKKIIFYYKCAAACKRMIALILLCFLYVHANSQDTLVLKPNNEISLNPDSNHHLTLITTASKKRFWRASGELMLAQIIPWSYNRYIRHAEFAKISFKSIGHNLKPSSWTWDDNNFVTNQFAHPYQGNLYFSSFRSNGYSFWQAAPAAFAGSFMWEVAGETHPPAPNDFINTGMGGIALGEMTYRLSNLIVNNKQKGFKRQANEVLAFLVNPMNGFNRIIEGKWGKVMENSADRMPSKLLGEFDLGGRRFSERGEDDIINKGKNEWYFRLRFNYGDPFVDRKKPFSNFSMVLEGGNNDTAKINTLRVSGFLHGWELSEMNKKNQHVLNVTANYDYYHNSSFYYGGQSVNMSLLSHFKTGKNTVIQTLAGAGVIALAAVQDEYLYYGEGRNYDYGPGVNLLADASLIVANKFLLRVHYRGGWFTTVNGNESTHFLNTVTSEMRYLFGKRISLGTEWGHFNLKGYFKDYNDTSRSYPFLRISAGYKLGL